MIVAVAVLRERCRPFPDSFLSSSPSSLAYRTPTTSPSRIPTHPLTRPLAHPGLGRISPLHTKLIGPYTYVYLFHLPSSLTLTYLIHTRLISFHPSYNNITHCILYPSSSSSSHIFIYAIPKSVAMEIFFFSFSFFFFLFSFFSILFVLSRLVSSLLVSLFRFILTHAYYSTSFVVPSRNVDLAWVFFCLYCNILYI